MTISFFFYQLLIGPIEIIFEAIYNGSNLILNNYGLSIIVLSLAMNFLLLPLYKRADAIQEEERVTEKRMEKAVAHIKKTFKGDERFMMLQTYYRQNHYKPFYVLKGFLPLLLEIPFFIAAYHFLSNYKPLIGTSFGVIHDLGAPDRLLHIGGLSVNVLPIIMTLINCVSSAIYTKGYSLKDKLQLFGMAGVFLVLLYDSPAGLVIYWTLNNLFSLIKNLITRIRNYRLILKVSLSIAGFFLMVFGAILYRTDNIKYKIFLVLCGLLFQAPLILQLLSKKRGARAFRFSGKPNPRFFLSGCIVLSLLTGVLIPSAVIVSSPEEFVNVVSYYTPLRHILTASLLAFGLFVIWFGIFYFMLSDRSKWFFEAIIWCASLAAIVNYMFFGTNLGLLSPELKYDIHPIFTLKEKALNVLAMLAVAGVSCLVYCRKPKIASGTIAVLIVAVLGLSAVNISGIQASTANLENKIKLSANKDAQINISKKGKNVVFIMLDRAINSFFPYILEDDPVLKQQYAGFTYYPNTVSFGAHTNFASSAIYGGYEYTPAEINKRSGELLADKQNESLKVLPVLFSRSGYQTTVFDPPLAGYQWIPDCSIFSDCEGITACNTEQGQFYNDTKGSADEIWRRNFFCYSVVKCCPLVLQPTLYLHGTYLGSVGTENVSFEKSYSVLKALPSITKISDDDANTFLSMCNSTAHLPVLLPSMEGGDAEAETRKQLNDKTILLNSVERKSHYQVNKAAIMEIGKWLDYLRREGVYDNTRIIIGADHGFDLNLFPELIFNSDNRRDDVMFYNPLLLIKDFGSTEYAVDHSFMTNADVPAALVKDLINDPINPFTGNVISSDSKNGSGQLVFTSHQWEIEKNHGTTFLPGTWYSVHDNIFDVSNWTRQGEW